MLPLPCDIKITRNVAQPTLTAYLPDPSVATGTAVVICPGGVFHFLPIELEGADVARWLSARGIAAFVLKYRVQPTEARDEDFIMQLQDRFTWGIDPARIGILGFSTGGVVAAGAAMEHDEESRPSFVAPIYLARSGRGITVPPDAPPLFLLAASDDSMAVGTSLSLYSAWKDTAHLVELHLYAHGGHGFGMKPQGLPIDHWIDRFGDWLQVQGLLG
jgi:acetyl esterase/lipase